MLSFQIQSSEVLARLKPFGITFEKSLSDLIKGIRSHSKESPESLLAFLDNAIQECKVELTTTDFEVKATAVLKLAYLEMYGFDMSWCNFQILEVMSSAKFQQKRIGYLAATQSFKSEQDLLILATNQFKKDLNSHNHIEVGLALSGIATIVTANLAKDIVDDVVMKLNHLKPYIRKKAVLALYKVILQYPESIRAALPRVIEKLDDPDVSVVSATLTVVCEISKKNPNIFIGYLPKFFNILESTSNNWLTIRVLKLFQSLLKIEPRMKKKILPSILNLMARTEATSLVYECISCIVNGGMLSADSSKDKEIAKQCINHIMKFFETRDSNLKFVGLIALINILKLFPEFMHRIKDVSAEIMNCLTDKDLIIKRKALEICQYLVTEDNIANIVKVLLLQLVPEENDYRIPEDLKLEITDKILEIASQDNYSNIPNFKWYVTALKELVSLTLLLLADNGAGTSVALSESAAMTIAIKLGREFKSLAVRVPSIRPFILNKVIVPYCNDSKPLYLCPLLMRDLYWILGEYISEIGQDEDESDDSSSPLGGKVRLFNTFVNNYIDKELNTNQFPVSSAIVNLSDSSVLVIYIQTLIKLLSGIIDDYQELYLNFGKLPYKNFGEIELFVWKAVTFLENWENHSDYEVQERTLSWLEFLKLCLDAMRVKDLISLDRLKTEEIAYYKKAALTNSKSATQVDSEIEEDVSSSEEEIDDQDMLELESESSDESADEAVEDNEGDEVNEDNEDKDKVSEEGEIKRTDETASVEDKEDKELPQLLATILRSFFKAYQLNPISATAQRRIPLPEDLDLDAQINDPPAFCLVTSEPESGDEDNESADELQASSESEAGHDDRVLKERLERLKDDPYYITPKSKLKTPKHRQKIFGVDDSNSMALSERVSLASPPVERIKKSKKPKKMKKEKVIVLDEETLGGPDLEEKVEKKKKTTKLFSNNFNLEDINMNAPQVTGEGEVEDKKDFEYDVDLGAFRAELEKKAKKKAQREERKKAERDERKKAERDAKKKLKKKNEEVQHREDEVTGEVAADEPENVESTALPQKSREVSVEPIHEVNTADKVVTVPKKKTKKKKRATILD